ncbi:MULTISPECIES: aldehyde dehydrogenase family protein [Actinomycetes]|uniref:aldehyde dehydrogenase family protein n=1 Tax=Actinomycetes TaxID=1760 RepID=UPI0002E8FA2A|nr:MULTISPECIES: aldehyde dehydrogenase family protein [Actinomycetes]
MTDPAAGQLIEGIENATDAEVRAAIEGVGHGYRSWRACAVAERAAIVARAPDLFEERADELAAVMTLAMGKRSQVARFVAPNLVLDNTILLKHASICPRSALAIEKILHEAGVPDDACVNLFASSRKVPMSLADPRIQGVSLTGSQQAGISVAAEAGRPRGGAGRDAVYRRTSRGGCVPGGDGFG